MTLADKLKKIRQQTDKINAEAGKVVAGFIDDPDIAERLTIKFIPTPNDDLNEALGGGFPVGRLTVISGLFDAGKTSLALETIGQQMLKDPDYTALWLESEHSLELSYITETFHIDPKRFVVIEMDLNEGAEQALDQCESYLRSGAFNAFVVNSLKALIPKTQLNKSMTEETVAMQARMNTKALNKFVSIAKEFDIMFICIQHLSTLIGSMSRDPYALGGGLFLRYSAAIILDMRKQSVLDTDPINKEEGQKYMISVKKNHVTPRFFPYVKVLHYIIYGEGTEKIFTTLSKAVKQGILKQSGAWIMWEDKNLRWQGKSNFRIDMKNNTDMLQTLRNLVNGEIEELTEAELEELNINPEEDNKTPDEIFAGEDNSTIIELVTEENSVEDNG